MRIRHELNFVDSLRNTTMTDINPLQNTLRTMQILFLKKQWKVDL